MYSRNPFTIEEQARIHRSSAAIIGLGGLGGHLAEQLTRAGIGKLKLFDMDAFTPSNLNRQRFCEQDTLGKSKVHVSAEALQRIRPDLLIERHPYAFSPEYAHLLKDVDVVLDGLDNIPSRLILEQACKQVGKVLVHGAVGEWMGQVTTIYPGEDFLERLYAHQESSLGQIIAALPAAIASFQVIQALQYLLGEEPYTHGRLFLLDFKTLQSSFVEWSKHV